MTTEPNPSIAAGWYPDQSDPSGFGLRWWDGRQWTAATQRMAVAPGSTAIEVSSPAAGASPYTLWIWLIVVLPLLSTTTFFAIDMRSYITDAMQPATGGTGSGMMMMTSPAYLLVSLLGWVLYAVSVVFAVLDRRSLLADGHPKPFHWAWAFLSSLVYVIGRSVVVKRTLGRGTAPMWVAIAVTLLSFVVIFGYTISIIVGVIQDYYPASFSSAS